MNYDLVEFCFWLSACMIVYVYLGYPFCAFLLSKIMRRSVQKDDIRPKVSILIAAYNEESCIANTIQNKLLLDYPKELLEIIVISDGSTDKTDELVNDFSEHGVLLIRQEPRAGKTAALNKGVDHANGEIIIFSDANSMYASNTATYLVSCFADESVGYVSGKMIYVNPNGTMVGDGCSAYMRYENKLRAYETKLGSVVGVDGGVDAMRRELYTPLNPDQLPDFVQPLKVVEKGYRVVYEPKALLQEEVSKDESGEYRMRVRVALRALWALWDMKSLLVGKVGLLFAWQLWSHKVLRYLCFFWLVVAFASNLFLTCTHHFYLATLLLQIAGYGVPLAPLRLKGASFAGKFVRFLRYFALLNLASAHALLKFLLGERLALWTPRKG